MARKRSGTKKFSVVKAVKANARKRVGQPKPRRIIEEKSRIPHRKPKHTSTLAELLNNEE